METNPRKPDSNTRRRRTWQEAGVPQPQPGLNTSTRSRSTAIHTILPITNSWNVPGLFSTTKLHKKWSNQEKRSFLLSVSVVFLFLLLRMIQLSTINSEEIPILIPYLQLDDINQSDLGGWAMGYRHFYLPDYLRVDTDRLADTGGIILLPKTERTIRNNDTQLWHEEKETQILQMDAVEHISKRHWFDDELEDVEMECRRPNWEKLHFPTCNRFHEFDLSRPYDPELAKRVGDEQDGSSVYISHGYFRDVFSVTQPAVGPDAKAVLKVARYSKHEMNYRPLFNARRGR